MNRVFFSVAALLGALMPLVFDSALKGAALLLVATLGALLLGRASAATRHLVWLVAIVALLVVPVLSVALPQWRVLPKWAAAPVVEAPSLAAVDTGNGTHATHRTHESHPATLPALAPQSASLATSPPAPTPAAAPLPTASFSLHTPSPTWREWLAPAWAVGFTILAFRLLAAHLLLRRAMRGCVVVRATPDSSETDGLAAQFHAACAQLGIRQRVTLLLDEKRTITVVWGVFRPRLLLPAESLEWSGEQLRSVLLHELAHLKRRDTLVQWLTQIACALHWWNPLVWLAAWRLHVERERACDDLVLASGVRPSAYAEHLLHVATKLSPARWTAACGLAMARKSSLEGRLLAVLSEKLNRRGVTSALAAIALILGAGIAIPVAMLRAADEKWNPPSGAHIGGNDFSTFCIHDGNDATFVIAYHGDFNSSSRSYSNAKARTWNNDVTLTAKKPGIALGFLRTHTAPGKLSITTTPAEGRDLSKPASAPRDFGQKEYDLAKGRVFLLTDTGLVRQFDLPTPVVTDHPSAKKLAALIAAIPPQEREDRNMKPKHKHALTLYENWQRLARANGDIPGALVGELAGCVRHFIKYNPTWKTVPALNEILPRLDATRDWKAADATALLDEVAAVHDSPLSTFWWKVKTIHQGKALPKKFADAPWCDAEPNGLRAAWVLEPGGAEHRMGAALEARLLIHNVGEVPVMLQVPTWWHQGGVTATDAKAVVVAVYSIEWTTIPFSQPVRLGPGEFIEINTPGVGLGKDAGRGPWAGPRVGSNVFAKPGDDITLTHSPVPLDGSEEGIRDGVPHVVGKGWWLAHIKARLSRELPLPAGAAERTHLLERAVRELFAAAPTAEEIAAFTADQTPGALDALAKRLAERPDATEFAGKLSPAPVKFRVLAADAAADKTPRVVLGPGGYPLSAGTAEYGAVTLKIVGRPVGDRRTNDAQLLFEPTEFTGILAPDPHKVEVPDGWGTWAIVCRPGEGFFYILHKGVARKIDYTNPRQVTDTPANDLPAEFRAEVKRQFDIHEVSAEMQAEIFEKSAPPAVPPAPKAAEAAPLQPVTDGMFSAQVLRADGQEPVVILTGRALTASPDSTSRKGSVTMKVATTANTAMIRYTWPEDASGFLDLKAGDFPVHRFDLSRGRVFFVHFERNEFSADVFQVPAAVKVAAITSPETLTQAAAAVTAWYAASNDRARWECSRVVVPESDYKTGQPVDAAAEKIVWGEANDAGLRLGLGGLEPAASFPVGQPLPVNQYIRNDGAKELTFSPTQVINEGVDGELTLTSDGKKFAYRKGYRWQMFLPRVRLAPGHYIALQSGPVSTTSGVNGIGFAVQPGEYTLQLTHGIGQFLGRPMNARFGDPRLAPGLGEWTGVLKSAAVPLRLGDEQVKTAKTGDSEAFGNQYTIAFDKGVLKLRHHNNYPKKPGLSGTPGPWEAQSRDWKVPAADGDYVAAWSVGGKGLWLKDVSGITHLVVKENLTESGKWTLAQAAGEIEGMPASVRAALGLPAVANSGAATPEHLAPEAPKPAEASPRPGEAALDPARGLVELTLRTHDGASAANQPVRLMANSGMAQAGGFVPDVSLDGVTDAAGKSRFGPVKPGTYTLSHLPKPRPSHHLSSGTDTLGSVSIEGGKTATLEARLLPPGTAKVSGLVTLPAGLEFRRQEYGRTVAKPLAAGHVLQIHVHAKAVASRFTASIQADRDGKFAFAELLPPGDYKLTGVIALTADEPAPQLLKFDLRIAETPLTVAADAKEVAAPELLPQPMPMCQRLRATDPAQRAPELVGTLTHDGKPVADALVELYRDQHHQHEASDRDQPLAVVRTNADGTYRFVNFIGAPSGSPNDRSTRAVLRLNHPTLVPASGRSTQHVTVPSLPGSVQRLNWLMVPGGFVDGSMASLISGDRWLSYKTLAFTGGGPVEFFAPFRTDHFGKFRVGPLPPGLYVVKAGGPSYPGLLPLGEVTVEAGKTSGLVIGDPPQPKHDTAQALFKNWQADARPNGKIPGGLIKYLASAVDGAMPFIKDAGVGAKFAALRPKFDGARDWTQVEVVALLDEITAIDPMPVSFAAIPIKFEHTTRGGQPLPAELESAAWGQPAENGLRAAWVFDPKAMARGAAASRVVKSESVYHHGAVLKSRVLFHNEGKAPIMFKTETSHQSDTHSARDAKGAEIAVTPDYFLGGATVATFRIAPGEYCEVSGHDIAIGSGNYKDERDTGKVGAIVEARVGDEVTLTHTVDVAELWNEAIAARVEREAPMPGAAADREQLIRRVTLDLTGVVPSAEEITAFTADNTPDAIGKLIARLQTKAAGMLWKGKLPTGETKFRVIAADPNAAKAPRSANAPGRYVLGDGVHLQVRQVAEGGQRTNSAEITFLSPDPKVASPHKPHTIALPEGLWTYAFAWERGSGALWLSQKGLLRKVDFSDPAKVTETRYADDKIAEAPIPADVLKAIGTALKVPGAPKQEYEPHKPAAPDGEKPKGALLANADWGTPLECGLRMAYVLEPRAKEYHLGSEIRARIVLHNAGKEPVAFVTTDFQQLVHTAALAGGGALTLDSHFWATRGRMEAYRLAPGEYCEINTPGLGIGAQSKDRDDWSNVRAGSWIQCAAGNEVVFAPGAVALSLQAKHPDGERIEGVIRAGSTNFRVLPPDADADKRPRVATGAGRYRVSDEVTFSVECSPRDEHVVNAASIDVRTITPLGPNIKIFRDDDGSLNADGEHKATLHQPVRVKLPDGYNTWATAWMKGAKQFWVAEADTLRRYDFANPAKVTETRYEGSKLGGAPISKELRAALDPVLSKPAVAPKPKHPGPPPASAPATEKLKSADAGQRSKIDWSQFPGRGEHTAPFDAAEALRLAAAPQKTQKDFRRLMYLILKGAAEKSPELQPLLKDKKLTESDDKSHSLALALGGYDFSVNGNKAALQSILDKLAKEPVGSDTWSAAALGFIDEWDVSIAAFEKHYSGNNDGSRGECIYLFWATREHAFPEGFARFQAQRLATQKLTPDALLGMWRGRMDEKALMLSFHRPPVEEAVRLDVYEGEATIGMLSRFTIAEDGKSAVVALARADSATYGTLRPGDDGKLKLELHNRQQGQPEITLARDVEPPATEPRQAEARELFEMWKTTANADGTIPGTFIGALATEVRAYVKAKPNYDSAAKLPKLLPRFVTSRDWTQAEAIKLLDEVAYYATEPISARVAKAKLPSGPLWRTMVEFQDIPVQIAKWSEAKDGLRIGMRVVDADWRVGGKARVELWLHNAGGKDASFNCTGPDIQDVGVRFTAIGADGIAYEQHHGNDFIPNMALGVVGLIVPYLPCMLPAGYVAMAKSVDLSFEAPDDKVLASRKPRFRGLTPGKYNLRCLWNVSDFSGDWTGTLTAPDFAFTLRGKTAAADGANPAPKVAKLPDDSYAKVGVPILDVDQHMEWSGVEQDGLCLGMRIAEDAEWRIGGEVKVELWVCNPGEKDVKFQYCPRRDIGLRVFLKGADGKEHAAEIAQFRGYPVFSHALLPAGHIFKAKEFSVVLLPPDKKAAGAEPHFTLPAGNYKFRCEVKLPGTTGTNAEGKQIIPAEGEWSGTIKSAAVDVKLVGADAAAAKPAQAKPAIEHAKVDIAQDGAISIDREKVTLDELKARAAKNAKKWFTIRADEDVPYAKVIEVVEALKAAGVTELSFAEAQVGDGKYRVANRQANYKFDDKHGLSICRPGDYPQYFTVSWPAEGERPACWVRTYPNVSGATQGKWAVVWEPGTDVLWWVDDSDVGKMTFTDSARVIVDREGRRNNFSRDFGLPEEVKTEFRRLGFVVGRDKTPGLETAIGGNTGGQSIVSAECGAWSIKGTVTDADGKPLADVPVRVTTNQQLKTEKTDAKGEYRAYFSLPIQLLSHWRGVTVEPVLEGFTERDMAKAGEFNVLLRAGEVPQRVRIAGDKDFQPGPIPRFAERDLIPSQPGASPGNPGRADFVMLKAGEITGEIVTADGKPAPPHFIAAATPEQRPGHNAAIEKSDAQGHFRLKGIPTNKPVIFTVNPDGKPGETSKSSEQKFEQTGTHKVRVILPAEGSGKGPVKVERLTDGASAPARGVIRGKVLKPDGTAAAGVQVRVDDGIERWKFRGEGIPDLPRTVTTADDGTFSIEVPKNSAATNYNVFADSDAFAPMHASVPAGGDVGVMQFAKGSLVTGRIIGLDGAGLAKVGIWSKQLEWRGRGPAPSKLTSTGADGTFSIPSIASGKYLLVVLTRDLGAKELAVAFANPVIEAKDDAPVAVEIRPLPTVDLTFDVRVRRGKAEFPDFELRVSGTLPGVKAGDPAAYWTRQETTKLREGKHTIAVPAGLQDATARADRIYMRKDDEPVFIWRRESDEKPIVNNTLALGLVDKPQTLGLTVQDAAK